MCYQQRDLKISPECVRYFSAKKLIIYTYCVHLCAAFTQNVLLVVEFTHTVHISLILLRKMCYQLLNLHALFKFCMHYVCLMQTHNMQLVVKSCMKCGTLTHNAMNVNLMHLRSFAVNLSILKPLRTFFANWLMSRFTRFLRKFLAPETAVA